MMSDNYILVNTEIQKKIPKTKVRINITIRTE